MRPFTIFQSAYGSFSFQKEKLVSHVQELVSTDAIYVLGASLYRRRTESVFMPEAPSSRHINDYFLLVIINDVQGKPLFEWQEKIEQHCKNLMTVTAIVLDTATLRSWLKDGHLFAETILQKSVPIFMAAGIDFSLPEGIKTLAKPDFQAGNEGLEKANEFMVGAELFCIRKQHKLAAFMLHQSAEYALSTLVKTLTGYHSHTHNLDRLLRYASLVSYQASDIFPQNTDAEKQLFKLLQKAYSEARYSSTYCIHFSETQVLLERVKQLTVVVKNCLSKNQEATL